MENMIIANIVLMQTNKGWYEVPQKVYGLAGVLFTPDSIYARNDYLYIDNMNVTLETFMAKYFKEDEKIILIKTQNEYLTM